MAVKKEKNKKIAEKKTRLLRPCDSSAGRYERAARLDRLGYRMIAVKALESVGKIKHQFHRNCCISDIDGKPLQNVSES